MMQISRHVTACRYLWNNSPQPALSALHTTIDSLRAGNRTLSTVPENPEAPSISYAGFRQGLSNILQLTDVLRAKDFPGVVHWEAAPIPAGRETVEPPAPADIQLTGGVRPAPMDGVPALTLPFRIHLTIPTPDIESVERGISKRERTRFHGSLDHSKWQSQVLHDQDAVDSFYHHMHLPTMEARHSGATRTETLQMARHVARHGGLLLLRARAQPIAGCLFTERRGTFTTRLLGVQGGHAEHYDSGAFKALYHLMLRHCAEQPRLQQMDLFGTEAFLSKGIFQWKRKLGAGVVPAPNHYGNKYLHVRITADTPSVRRFLARNPMLAVRHGSFVPVYFHDRDNPLRVDISSKTPGVDDPIEIDLNSFLSGSRDDGTPTILRRRGA